MHKILETLSEARRRVCSCASSTRGLFGGGYSPSNIKDTIDFVTIASTGNATDFGNLLLLEKREMEQLPMLTSGIWASGGIKVLVDSRCH